MINRNDYDPKAYGPTFQWTFLAPKYWGTWFIVLLMLPVSLLPISFHHVLANFFARALKRGRCVDEHVGVKAPGKENTTTFFLAKMSSVVFATHDSPSLH